jgi:hypothetical protein
LKSTSYPTLKFAHFVALIAAAALIGVFFHFAPSASIGHGTVHRASLNNGPRATRFAFPLSGADGPANTRTSGDLSIVLNGANPLQEECGETFSDPGATATNRAGRAVPVHVSGKVDSSTLGTYTLTYSAADARDSTSVERIVNIVDTSPPGIVLEGASTMTLSCGEAFVEPGAYGTDSCQGRLPVTISGSVNPDLQGTYPISYTATDAHNNTKTVTRNVIVGSTEDSPPTIRLNGDAEMTIECGGNFADPGAMANAPCSGALPVTTSGTVDVYAPGDYNLTYSASNNELTADAPRIVYVADTTPPLISLNGNNPMTIVRGNTFTDPGATARDGCAGVFAATAAGNVDSNRIGSYTITYTATDPSGNQATPVRRTVNVVDSAQMTAIHYPLWLIAVLLVFEISSLGEV